MNDNELDELENLAKTFIIGYKCWTLEQHNLISIRNKLSIKLKDLFREEQRLKKVITGINEKIRDLEQWKKWMTLLNF